MTAAAGWLFRIAAMVLVAGAIAAASLPARAALSAADRRVVAEIENYLNSMRTLSARFVQEESDGWIAEGRLYLKRPGKMRIEYAPPHRFIMVTTGKMLILYNGETDSTMHLPMSTSPAAFLLDERVDLTRNAEVRRITRTRNSYVLTVTGRGGGRGELRLTFTRKPFAIKEWTVIDRKKKAVRIVLLDQLIDHPIDPVKFLFQKPGVRRAKPGGARPPKVKSTDLPPN